jgi:hypothetical protein
MEQILGVYEIEPMGRLLVGRLRLSLPALWLLFAFLYFGVLLILHTIVGTPTPSSPAAIFQYPSASFYYPNLVAMVFDLVGNPTLLLVLMLFRSYIPWQLKQLEEAGLLKDKQARVRASERLYSMASKPRIQLAAVVLIPVAVAVLGLVVDVVIYAPQGAPEWYGVILSLMGRYARVAVAAQLVFLFIILGRYQYSAKLHLNHPDGCSGLLPFGRLALAVYAYLFVFAMMQAVGISAFERVLHSIVDWRSLANLWIVFPVALFFVFRELLWRPHHSMRKLQTDYLLNASASWTDYHQRIASSVASEVRRSTAPLSEKASTHIDDDMVLLDTWAKLDADIEQMPTWPIPKRTFRLFAIFLNPMVPILLPVVTA